MDELASYASIKNSELPDNDDRKTYKGRDVFLGDNIRDENHKFAMFDEIGTSPSSVEAGRIVDALSLFEG